MYGWVVLFNVLSWTVWLASLPVAWMVADRVPIRDGRRALPLAFHVCASLVFAFIQSALNAVFKLAVLSVAGQEMLLGRPLAFGPLLTMGAALHVRMAISPVLGHCRRAPRAARLTRAAPPRSQ